MYNAYIKYPARLTFNMGLFKMLRFIAVQQLMVRKAWRSLLQHSLTDVFIGVVLVVLTSPDRNY